MPVNFQPDGYHAVTPYLTVRGAAQAIEFYKAAFGAEELFRLGGPDGSVGHAEIKVGDSVLMLGDENPQWGAKAPDAGGSPVGLMVYVPDVDAVFAAAVAAGAAVRKAVQDQFYGDRSGTVTDPFGHTWTAATHVEDVSPEEMGRRADEWMQKHAQAQAA
ncbi:MAG: VOC family protein [Gemmataceae bacterium]|nr:VOC family protein [Gemmataceae bacterium]